MTEEPVIHAERLAHLPPVVQRYLTYSGVIGTPWIETVRLSYTGRFRLGADKPWMPMHAQQRYTTDPPGFVWKAWFRLAGLPLMYGEDTYQDGEGHMFGRLAGLFTIFDARGEELVQGTMLRYLQEMTWFPTAFLSPYITWAGVDDHCADVTYTHAERQVSARLYFDDAGRLLTFIAQRYREQGGRYTLDTWAAPVTEYGRLAGLNLPLAGRGVWQLAGGDLAYIELSMGTVVYNEGS